MSKLMMLVAAKWREFTASQPAEEAASPAGSPAEADQEQEEQEQETEAEEPEEEPEDEPEVVRSSARASRASKKKPEPVSCDGAGDGRDRPEGGGGCTYVGLVQLRRTQGGGEG